MIRSVLAVLLAALCGVASAQAFPSRPLRILVPFPPGGGTDVAARALAEHLTRDLGQPVVDNRPGGNSVIATEALARSQPDGHTLLLTTDFHSINAAFGAALPHDSLKAEAAQSRLASAGVDAAPSTPEELEAWVRRDIANYRRMIELTGARPEGR